MMRALSLGPLAIATFLACALACTGSARAEQFVVTDVTYTHSGATTDDSHYRVNPAAGTPSNWQSPINYGTGSAHVRLEVKTKPGATPTKFQICFEGTPSYACTNQSQTYTTTGVYEWTTDFEDFYYGGTVNWNQGVSKVALILKDTNNNKPQGNPMYVPTDLRVVVTIISPGASFVPPVLDAGTQDAGTDAGPRDAGVDTGTARPIADAGRDAGADAGSADPAPRDAGGGSSTDAGSAPAQNEKDAGNTGGNDPGPAGGGGTDAGSSAGADAGDDDDAEEDEGDGGCSLAPGVQGGSVLGGLVLAAGVAMVARRRRRRG